MSECPSGTRKFWWREIDWKTDFWPSQLLPGVNTAPAHSYTAPAHSHYCPCPPAATTDWPCIRPCFFTSVNENPSSMFLLSVLNVFEDWGLEYSHNKIVVKITKPKIVLWHIMIIFWSVKSRWLLRRKTSTEPNKLQSAAFNVNRYNLNEELPGGRVLCSGL